MNLLKKYGKIMLIWTISLLVYILTLTLLNYFQFIKFENIIKLNFTIVSIITFIFGIIMGKTSTKKGYIEGLKLGGLIIFIFILLNIIFIRNFSLHIFVYYLTIIASATFGSIIGINLKRK